MRRMHAANASVARHPLARRRGTAVAWLVVYLALLALLLLLRFRTGAWRRLELVEPIA